MNDAANPTVSVLIPSYNRAEYLPESIASIRSQRFSGSLEIICVDDGSQHDPFARITVPPPPEVRLLRKAHEGVGAARQYALEHARGTFIAFNDDDDLWSSDSLAERLSALERYPELDLVFTDLREFSASGDAPKTYNSGRREFSRARRVELPNAGPRLYRYDREQLLGAFMTGAPMFFQTVLARRAFLDRMGGMDPRTKSCGDCLDFGVRATYRGVIGYLDAPTCKLRRGHSHMTSGNDWLEREMNEFFTVFPGYTAELQALLKPWVGRYLSQKAWTHFSRREYAEAAAVYRRAASYGSIGLRAQAKRLVATIRQFI